MDKSDKSEKSEKLKRPDMSTPTHPIKDPPYVVESLTLNKLSWFVIIVCVSIVSYPNVILGMVTFISMIFFVYFAHKFSHLKRNLFTIIHHYHHENDNFFSHFSQIILELTTVIILLPYYYYYNTIFFDVWTIGLFLFFYTTIHNYNYGYKRVNDVHYLHHLNIFTNIGPDICDVAFLTKNPKDINPENTDHYISNIIVGTIIVMLIKYLCLDPLFKEQTIYFVIRLVLLFFAFLMTSSLFLIFNYKGPSKISPINQPTNQPTNQSTNQPINQLTNKL